MRYLSIGVLVASLAITGCVEETTTKSVSLEQQSVKDTQKPPQKSGIGFYKEATYLEPRLDKLERFVIEDNKDRLASLLGEWRVYFFVADKPTVEMTLVLEEKENPDERLLEHRMLWADKVFLLGCYKGTLKAKSDDSKILVADVDFLVTEEGDNYLFFENAGEFRLHLGMYTEGKSTFPIARTRKDTEIYMSLKPYAIVALPASIAAKGTVNPRPFMRNGDTVFAWKETLQALQIMAK